MLNNYVKNDSFWMTLASKVLLKTATNDVGESIMRTTDMMTRFNAKTVLLSTFCILANHRWVLYEYQFRGGAA